MTRMPRILTVSPPGRLGVRVATAGSRAGGLGVLDFGFRCEPREAAAAIRRAGEALAGRRFGVRLPARACAGPALAGAPANLAVVVARGGVGTDWAGVLAELTRAGRLPVAEVTSRSGAREAAEAGFRALIVAGHEAGGFVSDESSFILLQATLALVPDGCRVWVRGGIGPDSAAGCVAAGAAGVVLDGALLLARESPLSPTVRERVGQWDGAETTAFETADGRWFRGFAPRGSALLTKTREAALDGSISDLVGWDEGRLWPAGQDAAFAADLARRHVTVGGIVQEVERAITQGLSAARSLRALSAGSPMAVALGTTYPVVQGPMTRVSDRPEFARAVADGGGLPFLALALMRGDEARALLSRTASLLSGRNWGVGLLGFNTPELRGEQTAAILEARPPFALIAGGRPDQARELEAAGVATFLHVPSPGLLRQFLREGSRRFVLEGRECGGHVGPRPSLVLWGQAGPVVREAVGQGVDPGEIHLLYAGGVHDGRSAAAVAGVSAPLAALGVKVGVLVGTAYLFTREAVESGAVVAGFQEEALRCESTVLLETGPGHQVRVSPTPYAERFGRERDRLSREGRTAEELRTALEGLNVGRLRVAAKGVDRLEGAGAPLGAVAPDDQRERGLYMLGQAATLRRRLTTVSDLHRGIAEGAQSRLDALAHDAVPRRRKRSRPSDVAVVGMASVVPAAADVRTFWQNTLRGHDAISEVPADRWDWSLYYDADPKAPDKIISRWGGFVPEIPFDPLRYGMPPSSLPSIEPLHLLALEVVRAALEDAGYRDRPFPRERTAVVLGAGGGAAQLAMGYALRSYLPLLDTVIPGAGTDALAKCGSLLPEWTEDSFPGILLNVAAGRIANRFDLGGANYTVDAACGSSLAAAALAVRELESGAADVVVLGGADTVQNPFTYLAFSKTHAFSPRGRCRPFDSGADGIVISEGVAVVVLKRLADAERDGDRIYSVIKGLGASSDGRAKGLTAPNYDGQVRALRRAYDKAGVSPGTIGYVEAHGTGTAAGDQAEVDALKHVFREAGASTAGCALGSVKSLIGHTKCAAGLAGLINASLALHHRVLPPTIGVETPNPKADFPNSPFHLSTRARPWLRADPLTPRRAGVSAFGFGGTNFHAVLEAYEGDPTPALPPVLDRPAELFVWRGADRAGLLEDLGRLERALAVGPVPPSRDLAHALAVAAVAEAPAAGPRLAIVAAAPDDLLAKLRRAIRAVADGPAEFHDPAGIAYDGVGRWAGAPVAFLFPGQGSQSPDMLGELAVHLPELLDAFEACDAALARRGRTPVGPKVFPPPAASAADAARQAVALAAPDVAQPALGAAAVGLLAFLGSLGLEPDVLAGHSYGELVALHAAGAFPGDALAELSEARGRFLLAAVGDEPGAMAAVQAGPDALGPLLDDAPGVVIANRNGPAQTVVSGPVQAVTRVAAAAQALGLRARPLPVACAYHSPLVAGAAAPLAALAARLVEDAPGKPVYSNVTAAPYPADPAAVARQLGDHLASPVRFAEMVEAMHGDGARVFVEVGPGAVLTPLVASILVDRPHLALACDPPARKGLAGLLGTLGRLFAAGVAFDPRPLTASRSTRTVVLRGDRFEPTEPALPPSTWMVNGARARPAFGPQPRVFGAGPALPRPEPARNGRAPAVDIPADLRSLQDLPAGSDAVFAAFQQTMQTFLDVQRSTMLGFLAAEPETERPRQAAPMPIPTPVLLHPSPAPPPVEIPHAREGTVVTPHATGGDARGGTNGHGGAARKLVAHDASAVERRLREIVRDRTGYPSEMLQLDLDLEADLGIDSIKRVEILGTLRDGLPAGSNGSETELMDNLSRARTLGAIVDRVNRHLAHANGNGNGHANGKTPDPPALERPAPAARSGVRRMVIEPVDAPFSGGERPAGLAAGGLVIVTDDGRGVAAAAEARLRTEGYRTVRVVPGSDAGEAWGVDFTSPDAVARLVERARGEGSIAGVLHALPLREAADAGLDAAGWDDRLGDEVRGLFLLARACGDDLARAAGRGGAALVAATGMGGAFASLPGAPAHFFPGHGGVAGLVKTLAREWPGVRARVVDLDPRDAAWRMAHRLTAELLAADDRAEVGYHRGRRISLRAEPRELPPPGGNFTLRPGEPVLVTGGARGITAAVAADLAARWRPTLLLVGTSPLPPAEDAPDVAGLSEPAEVKARLLERLGRGVGPAELERAFQSLRRDREIRANLRVLRDAGSAVEYARVDVRDAGAMRDALGGWRDRFGPLAGFVHGAGVIQDKLLRDKTPESFDLVMGTKLGGALTLARLVEPDALKFAAFFSSVAGRFGNPGQADYAAANEALNKLALWLDRRWPGRVVSMIWGPWSGVGMVSDLEQHLGRRGLGMIAPADGRARLGDELASGVKGDVEVIVAGDLGNLADPREARRTP